MDEQQARDALDYALNLALEVWGEELTPEALRDALDVALDSMVPA